MQCIFDVMKGSEQRAPRDEADYMRGLDAKEQAEMIEQMKKMNDEMGDDFLPTPQTSTPQAKKPSVAKAPELKVAEFTLTKFIEYCTIV